MTTLLADHNIAGLARLLMGTLQSLGWLELLDVRLLTFADAGLAPESTDREVWRRAQELQAFLLTDNRNNDGPDSLEQTLIEEIAPESYPVITVGSTERLRRDTTYRTACAERLVDVVVNRERYFGTPRLYIP